MKAGTRSLSILWNSPTRISIVGQHFRNFRLAEQSFQAFALCRILVESIIVCLPNACIVPQVAPDARNTTTIIQIPDIHCWSSNRINGYKREIRPIAPKNWITGQRKAWNALLLIISRIWVSRHSLMIYWIQFFFLKSIEYFEMKLQINKLEKLDIQMKYGKPVPTKQTLLSIHWINKLKNCHNLFNSKIISPRGTKHEDVPIEPITDVGIKHRNWNVNKYTLNRYELYDWNRSWIKRTSWSLGNENKTIGKSTKKIQKFKSLWNLH